MPSSCDCLSRISQTASVALSQKAVPFDVILDTSHKISSQWRKILHCESCNKREQTLATLSQIAAGLLNFYVAAFSSYSIAELEADVHSNTYQPSSASSSSTSSHLYNNNNPEDNNTNHGASSSSSPTTLAPRICIPSQMTLGESPLDATESRILAEQLLADCLLSLDASLGDLEGAIDDILHHEHGWQTSGRVISTKTVVVETMNRLAKVIGQLRFEAAGVGR